MTLETLLMSLRAFSRRRPFLPFVLQLLSGEEIRIRHPEAWRAGRGMFLLREPDGRVHLFDAGSVQQLFEPPTTGGQPQGDTTD